ncbi:MAG: hypothetical protein ACOCP8_02640 [archaeon]
MTIYQVSCNNDFCNHSEVERREVIEEFASDESLLKKLLEKMDKKDLEIKGSLLMNLDCPSCKEERDEDLSSVKVKAIDEDDWEE